VSGPGDQPDSVAARRLFLGAAAGLSLGGQGQPAMAAPAKPAQGVNPAITDRRQRVAVVLGGGSARGFAHIGVIKALEAAGVQPDLIVGSSAGAMVGAFWAGGYSGAQMEALAYRVRDDEVIDVAAGNANLRRGLVSGQALQSFVNVGLRGRSLEGLLTPFIAVATRYPSGVLHAFRNGDPGFAVRASCSIPGVFMPASLQGQEYLDGGLCSPLPVQTARANGATLVIAVDVGGADPGASTESTSGLYQLLLRSFDIMGDALRRQEAAGADIVIRPDVSRVASTDLSARRALIEAGFVAGQRLAPVVLDKLRARG
jgi:NTE family protein